MTEARHIIVVAELLPPRGAFARTREPASLVGALIAAALGVAVGVTGAFLTGGPPPADAAMTHVANLDLRDAPLTAAGVDDSRRSALIEQIVADEAPERLAVGASRIAPVRGTPKLIIIFDDMGPDAGAFREIAAMPGPVTLSFLPYADHVQPQVDAAKARGDDILLHLPMEPGGDLDAGPHSLSASMGPDRLFEELEWNLDRFDGYVGVNNHMGSKFTRNEQAMKRVLAMISQRGLFFIDSLTTGGSVAAKAGAAVGAEVYLRDVFLDAEPGPQTIRRQLAFAEKIAARTGYAIVICHPRRETLDIIGPWLTTALARGYSLATVSVLHDIKSERGFGEL